MGLAIYILLKGFGFLCSFFLNKKIKTNIKLKNNNREPFSERDFLMFCSFSFFCLQQKKENPLINNGC
jgi:hypothetical protein